jgi:hypothetical protein
MPELPPPDLLDSAGRLRRLFVATFTGVAAAVAAYLASDAAVEPDRQLTTGGYRFVYFITALVGAISFVVTLTVQNRYAKRTWENDRVPRAEIR